MAFEDATSKLLDIVCVADVNARIPFINVADVNAEECIDNSLVEILMLMFGRNFEPEYLILKVKFCRNFEANFPSTI